MTSDELDRMVAESLRHDYRDEIAEAITAMRDQIKSLREALSMCDDELYAPDRDCSCHLAPPCHDCVTYGAVREAKATAAAVLRETK